MRLIVTDLTRFHNQDIVCIAGIDPKTGRCIRPLPYLKVSRCIRENILPGAILSGTFSGAQPPLPHVEDRDYSELKYFGHCDVEEYERILLNSKSQSVKHGFGVEMEHGQKLFMADHVPAKSIITIAVEPGSISFLWDQYNTDRIKTIFTDQSGREFRYLSVTDLCLCEYAEQKAGEERAIKELNDFLGRQNNILLRVGLTRRYKSPDGRDGYWIQVNGLYTFPNVFPSIRSYFHKK